MKIPPRQIESFVKNPAPAARVILLFGPDQGLMRQRSTAIARTIVEDINDPFNVAILASSQLAEDPACLNDEANAMSLMGGARLIRIENAEEKIVPAIKGYLQNPNLENLVLIEAGDLGTKSSLRKLCESAANAAAVPCYVDDQRELAVIIRTTLKENSFMIDNDALQWLAANISGDRLKALGEIDKLMTYQGLGTQIVSREIHLGDVMACCGESGAVSFDDLVYNLGGAVPDKTLRAYNQLLGEGIPVVAILRAAQNHFRRLHYIKTLVISGESQEEALKKLTPKVFYKFESAFIAQLNRWPEPALRQILGRLAEIEAQSKTTGCPAETLCGQAFLSISSRR